MSKHRIGHSQGHGSARHERGVFLIEALVAILIFSLGILGMIAMGATAVSAQSDAQYRSDADGLANDIASQIALKVNRSNATNLRTSLLAFEHQAGGTDCAFSGDASQRPEVTAWADKVTAAGTGLPGATSGSLQIAVSNNAANFNRVVVTICWQAPTDKAMRKHMLVTYVN